MIRAAIARLARRSGRRPFLLALAVVLATGFLLALDAGIVDLHAQQIRPACRASVAIVDGKRRQPTPALIKARETAAPCRLSARRAGAVVDAQPILERLDARLAILFREQSRPMRGPN